MKYNFGKFQNKVVVFSLFFGFYSALSFAAADNNDLADQGENLNVPIKTSSHASEPMVSQETENFYPTSWDWTASPIGPVKAETQILAERISSAVSSLNNSVVLEVNSSDSDSIESSTNSEAAFYKATEEVTFSNDANTTATGMIDVNSTSSTKSTTPSKPATSTSSGVAQTSNVLTTKPSAADATASTPSKPAHPAIPTNPVNPSGSQPPQIQYVTGRVVKSPYPHVLAITLEPRDRDVMFYFQLPGGVAPSFAAGDAIKITYDLTKFFRLAAGQVCYYDVQVEVLKG